MRSWRRLAAAVVAASSVLLNAQAAGAATVVAPVSDDAQECFRSTTQMAADAYRAKRREILQVYRDATREHRGRLRQELAWSQTPGERRAAWLRFNEATVNARSDSHARLQQARMAFRTSVYRARSQLGLDGPA